MKNSLFLFAVLMLAFYSTITAITPVTAAVNTPPSSISSEVNLMGTPIHVTLTATNGCQFAIDGNFSVWSRTFSGTVIIKCPGQLARTYVFEFRVPEDEVTIEYISGDMGVWTNEIEVDEQLKTDIAEELLNSGN